MFHQLRDNLVGTPAQYCATPLPNSTPALTNIPAVSRKRSKMVVEEHAPDEPARRDMVRAADWLCGLVQCCNRRNPTSAAA